MKATRFHRHGDASVLVYEDAPDPAPPRGWAVVRVRACALNHLDLWQRRGLEKVKIPMPHISGADNYCAQYDVLGYQSAGGYAEYVTVPPANLIPIPDHVSDVDAAAFPLAFLTA